jgi:arsenate reductase
MAGRQRVAVPQQSGDLEDVPRVLFVCPDNAGASLMAEAFLNDLARGRLAGASAGIRPADRPRPEVVQAMAEVGARIEDRPGRALTPELAESAVRIVAIRCHVEDACPGVKTPVEEWPIPTSEGKSPDEVEAIRDGIEIRVRNLTASLLRDAF